MPWIALEHVEGSNAGTTLAERIELAGEGGVDPVRVHRLARGMIEGVRVLHRLGVIHRDLKPNNVFVAGPVDVETPKIADCGIARVEGLRLATVQAMTPGYGAPEQSLSRRAMSLERREMWRVCTGEEDTAGEAGVTRAERSGRSGPEANRSEATRTRLGWQHWRARKTIER
ncbi:protein kinase domain-containing protein [Sorangium sp. So ce693]|uniref:protein kinase domain-containing protein n=1 Tax=Sorangium sp. So ce693 TaxID=3133318 RepID=UPI003F5F80FA